jgi:hypothetical protein
MKTHYSFLCAALLLISTSSFAQKIKWETGGDLAFLKGQQSLATGYDYSNVTVKGESQEAYVAAQKGELNKDKAGEGDVFETEWTSARAQKYQPAFEKLMNKRLESDGIVVKAENGAKYKVVLVTGDMQLGKGKMFVKKKTDMVQEEVALASVVDVAGWKSVGKKVAGAELVEIELVAPEPDNGSEDAPTLF